MVKSVWRTLFRLRLWFFVVVAAAGLAACGGGGDDGDGRTLDLGTPALQGTWQLTVSGDTGTTAPVTVAAADVPSSQEATVLGTSGTALLVGSTSFQGFTVSVNGSTIVVTGSNTNYVMVIDSISVSNYQDCGTCQVGSSVVFTITLNFTESGELAGVTIPARSRTVALTFRYTRTA